MSKFVVERLIKQVRGIEELVREELELVDSIKITLNHTYMINSNHAVDLDLEIALKNLATIREMITNEDS